MSGFAGDGAGPMVAGILALGSFLTFAGFGLVAAVRSGQEAAV